MFCLLCSLLNNLVLQEVVERGRSQLLFNSALYGPTSSCSLVIDKQVCYGVSGTPWAAWNTITGANFASEEEANERIDEIERYYKARKMPCEWWVRPTNSPRNLKARRDHSLSGEIENY